MGFDISQILGISLGLLLGEDISHKLNPAIAPFWSMATRGAAIGLMDKRDDIPSVAARKIFFSLIRITSTLLEETLIKPEVKGHNKNQMSF